MSSANSSRRDSGYGGLDVLRGTSIYVQCHGRGMRDVEGDRCFIEKHGGRVAKDPGGATHIVVEPPSDGRRCYIHQLRRRPSTPPPTTPWRGEWTLEQLIREYATPGNRRDPYIKVVQRHFLAACLKADKVLDAYEGYDGWLVTGEFVPETPPLPRVPLPSPCAPMDNEAMDVDAVLGAVDASFPDASGVMQGEDSSMDIETEFGSPEPIPMAFDDVLAMDINPPSIVSASVPPSPCAGLLRGDSVAVAVSLLDRPNGSTNGTTESAVDDDSKEEDPGSGDATMAEYVEEAPPTDDATKEVAMQDDSSTEGIVEALSMANAITEDDASQDGKKDDASIVDANKETAMEALAPTLPSKADENASVMSLLSHSRDPAPAQVVGASHEPTEVDGFGLESDYSANESEERAGEPGQGKGLQETTGAAVNEPAIATTLIAEAADLDTEKADASSRTVDIAAANGFAEDLTGQTFPVSSEEGALKKGSASGDPLQVEGTSSSARPEALNSDPSEPIPSGKQDVVESPLPIPDSPAAGAPPKQNQFPEPETPAHPRSELLVPTPEQEILSRLLAHAPTFHIYGHTRNLEMLVQLMGGKLAAMEKAEFIVLPLKAGEAVVDVDHRELVAGHGRSLLSRVISRDWITECWAHEQPLSPEPYMIMAAPLSAHGQSTYHTPSRSPTTTRYPSCVPCAIQDAKPSNSHDIVSSTSVAPRHSPSPVAEPSSPHAPVAPRAAPSSMFKPSIPKDVSSTSATQRSSPDRAAQPPTEHVPVSEPTVARSSPSPVPAKRRPSTSPVQAATPSTSPPPVSPLATATAVEPLAPLSPVVVQSNSVPDTILPPPVADAASDSRSRAESELTDLDASDGVDLPHVQPGHQEAVKRYVEKLQQWESKGLSKSVAFNLLAEETPRPSPSSMYYRYRTVFEEKVPWLTKDSRGNNRKRKRGGDD